MPRGAGRGALVSAPAPLPTRPIGRRRRPTAPSQTAGDVVSAASRYQPMPGDADISQRSYSHVRLCPGRREGGGGGTTGRAAAPRKIRVGYPCCESRRQPHNSSHGASRTVRVTVPVACSESRNPPRNTSQCAGKRRPPAPAPPMTNMQPRPSTTALRRRRRKTGARLCRSRPASAPPHGVETVAFNLAAYSCQGWGWCWGGAPLTPRRRRLRPRGPPRP